MGGSHQGRLELTWTNKDRALLSTGHGKYDYEFADPHDPRVLEVRLLHEVDRIEAPVPTERPDDLPAPTTDNLLITGDSMHALDALAKTPEYAAKYLGQAKLVYIDPPFNTSQTFAHYEDSIEHSVWLTLVRDRIRQIKPLLSDEGSLWVHLDDVEVHRCRSVLDEELGPENFVAEIVWQKSTSPRNDTSGISVSHDSILVYRKSDQWRPNRLARLAVSNTSRYKSRDGDPVPWRDGDATAGKAATNHPMVYAIQHPVTGGLMYPTAGRCWGKSQSWFLEQLNNYARYELRVIDDAKKRAVICAATAETVKADVPAIMLAEPLESAAAAARQRHSEGLWPDLVFLDIEKERVQRKKHLVDDGRVPETWWESSDVGGSLRGKNQIRDLFPDIHAFATPKPEELLQRIIQIATDPGDLVLDCFAGSGTTAAVAHKMGRRWVTSELLSETVETFTKPRLTKVVQGGDPGGVTTSSERVDATEHGLPEGMTPAEAQEFTRLLGKVVKDRDGLDTATVKTLRAVTKTREASTQRWYGGGGFTHLEVGPSMYEVDDDGDVFLSEHAVNGAWSQAVAAQLKFTLTPDHPVFCGMRGRQRLVVVDGVADDVVVRSVLEHLGEKERAVVVAKAVLPEAAALLAEKSPGSRVRRAPDGLFPKRTVK